MNISCIKNDGWWQFLINCYRIIIIKILALLLGSTGHRERGTVFQVTIFPGNICVNKY